MSAQCAATAKLAVGAPMSMFERYLTVWVFLCILAGIVLGQLAPGVFQAIGNLELARVNLPVGLLIWVMIIPMLVKVDFGALHEVKQHVRGIGVALFVNWLVKPFSMAFLAWLFVRQLFAPWLPAEQLDSYIAGLILLAAAPCTAMVFVWSRLSNGDPLFTLSQVAVNDAIMVPAFAPLVGLLLGISALAYWLNRVVGEKHNVDCPSALIGASNFFELAVAAAISLFGFQSGAALATVVGVLIEVPVMLLVVKVVNQSKGWYERGARA